MRYILSFAFVLSFVFSFSVVATAQTATSTTDAQVFIRELQEQITALQTRIAKLEKQLTEQGTELATVKEEVRLERTLHRGVSGGDVRQLQEFLKRFPDIYPKGLVTGYYGALTEEAVKRLQEKQGIISADSPDTAGFGQVGPKTLSRLNELITAGAGASGTLLPGLLTAPGIAQRTSDKAATPLSLTSSTTAAVASVSATGATAMSGTTTPTLPVASATSVSSAPAATGWSNVRFTNFTGGGSYGEYPALASDGNGYGVVWEGSDGVVGAENIFFARLDAAGAVSGSPTRLTNHAYCGCVTANAPTIVWSGSRYGVAWVDNQVIVDNALGQVVRLATLDSGGNKLTDIAVSAIGDNVGNNRPYLKWTGTNFAVGWQNWNASAKFYAEVNSDGKTIAVYDRNATTAEWSSVTSLAFSGSASVSGDWIYFSNAGNQEPVSALSGSNTLPFITQNGSKYAIVWTNIQNNVSQLYFGLKIPGSLPPPSSSTASAQSTATTTTTVTATTTSASSSSSTASTSSGSSSSGGSTTTSSSSSLTATATTTATTATTASTTSTTTAYQSGAACSGLNLTIDKTSYVKGELVRYTAACAPGGTTAYIEVETVTTSGTLTGGGGKFSAISAAGFQSSLSGSVCTSCLPLGDYMLWACLVKTAPICQPPTASVKFTVTAPATTTTTTVTTQTPAPLGALPDLALLAIDTPRQATAGQNITLRVNARNAGLAKVPASKLKVAFAGLEALLDVPPLAGTPDRTTITPESTSWVSWPITVPTTASGYYIFYATADPDNQIVESSELNNELVMGFNVLPAPISSITVTSPNGGSTWDIYHYNQSINYTLNGVSRVGFKLLKGSQVVYSNSAPITTNSTNLSLYPTFDGVASTYYNSIGGGSDYKIRVFDWDHPEVYDDSDNYFTIPLPDIKAPVVSSVSASGITSNFAVITWTTDEPATGQVNYGSAPLNWALTPQDVSYTTSHSFTLSNLAANTPYTYRVYSLDAVSNGPQGFPPEYTFTTLPMADPSIHMSGSSGSQTSDSSILVNVGATFTISGSPQNLQGLSYYSGSGYPTSGYFNMAYFFVQTFGDNNSCGNNQSLATGVWTMTCTAKVPGSSYFYVVIYANGKTYTSNTVNVTVAASQSSLDLRTSNLAAIYYALESLKATVEKLSKLVQ